MNKHITKNRLISILISILRIIDQEYTKNRLIMC